MFELSFSTEHWRIEPERFRTAFEAKSPLEPFLEKIPIHLITNSAPGLIGCAAVAAGW